MWWPIILATWEVETGRIVVLDQPLQKISEPPSQAVSWVWWYTSVISATQEV
jgi:hypothetical protein